MSATSSARSRQKSCVPCANSKRKCDQVTPTCSRCAAKAIYCTYKSSKASHTSSSPESPHGAQYDTTMEVLPVIATGAPVQMQSQLLPPSSDFNTGLSASSMDLAGSELYSTPDDSFFAAYDAHLLSPIYPTVGVMDRDRAKYCVTALKSYPSHLALTSKTVFINLHCYTSLPLVLQEACSVSALYTTKNDRNEDMIREIVSTKVNRLVQESQNQWTVSEHLAAVQALIIFQIIRLFDGDIKQRSDGEEHEPVLRQWTEQLLHRTGVKAFSTSDILSSSYSSWLFTESITRTVIVSLLVEAMYWIQKRGYCTLVDEVTDMSFTAQRALWEAKSEHHWMKAKMEQQGFYVQKMEFGELMERGEARDVDDLGILMLVTYKGVDGVNDWILRSGSSALIET